MSSQALAPIPTDVTVQGRAAAMDDAEIQSTFRKAAALAQSGLFKDVRSAEQAFAKLLIGRTLGLSEAQSLSLYAMEGKIELPYPMLANFIRSREGYGYAVWWIKSKTGKAYGPEQQPPDGDREAVLATEDSPTDLRPIVGCSIAFTAPDGPRGVSTWTVEDTIRAGLDKDRGSARSNHTKYPRNLYLARAMSNGCKWYLSEVLAGLPVYAEGEVREQALGEGEESGADPGWGDVPIAAAHEVEKLIRRARRLGHVGLSDRATAQMTLSGQSADTIREWIQRAHEELSEFEARKREPSTCGAVFGAGVDGDERPARCDQPAGHDGPHSGPVVDFASLEVGDGEREEPEPEAVDGEPVAEDELGPMTAEQLDRELAEAKARAGAAQSEGEHRAAAEDVARLTKLRAGLDDAQGRLDGSEG